MSDLFSDAPPDLDTHTVAVIRTDEQVDSLPVGSVLFDVDRDVIVRADEGWRFWGDESAFTEDAVICLPALLIHVGGAEPWHATG